MTFISFGNITPSDYTVGIIGLIVAVIIIVGLISLFRK